MAGNRPINRAALAGGVISVFGILWLTTTPAAGGRPTAAVERGRYLVAFGACGDCHTPLKMNPTTHQPEPDNSRLLSGHPEGAPDPTGTLGATDLALIGGSFTAFRLPFGVVYSANLTPDRETGLGGWTEAMFIRAVRTGKHMGGQGRPILPPMPWYGLAALNDADLAAIFAYLRTIPAVRNGVSGAKVPDAALTEIDRNNREILAHMKVGRRP